jgi:hypothetical protein
MARTINQEKQAAQKKKILSTAEELLSEKGHEKND